MLIPQLPKLAVRPLLPGLAPQVSLSEVADVHLHISVAAAVVLRSSDGGVARR